MTLPKANEFTPPADLVNLGLKCRECGSKEVVYTVSVLSPYFPLGPYCYDCLLKHCRATKRRRLGTSRDEYMIPTPMEWNLLSRLKVALGLETPRQNPSF